MTDPSRPRPEVGPQRSDSAASTRPCLTGEPEGAPFSDLADPMPLADLILARDSLGPVVQLDLTAWDLVPAHFVLGEEVAEQVRRHLEAKLGALPPDRVRNELRAARECRRETERRSRSEGVDARISRMLRTYLDCLGAWAEGTRLAGFAREALAGVTVDGVPVSGDDLALLLQMETVGCQTGLMRSAEGSVIVWHTEEDRAHHGYSRFDRLRLASFRSVEGGRGRVISGFVYPDLLLGPAFGWADDVYIQAVDSLYLDPRNHVTGVPANAITWVCLFLAGEMMTADVVRALGPAHNGYAVASSRRQGGRVTADTTEFVDGVMARTELGEQPGSSHFQVNLLSETARDMSPGRELVDPGMERMLRRRRSRARRSLEVVRRQPDGIGGCARLLGSRVGGAAASANPDVKAHFLGHLTASGASFCVGPGPAIRQGRRIDVDWSPETPPV